MLEGTQVTGFDRVAPQLENGERDETNRRDLDTGWNSIVVGCPRRSVKVVVREVPSWMAVVPEVELLAFGVVVPVVSFVGPVYVETAGVPVDSVREVEVDGLRIERVVEPRFRDEWFVLLGNCSG